MFGNECFSSSLVSVQVNGISGSDLNGNTTGIFKTLEAGMFFSLSLLLDAYASFCLLFSSSVFVSIFHAYERMDERNHHLLLRLHHFFATVPRLFQHQLRLSVPSHRCKVRLARLILRGFSE